MSSAVGAVRVLMDRPKRSSRGSIDCVVGDQILVKPGVLATYCFDDLSPVAQDLSLLAASIAFADRVVPRRLSQGWKRNLRIQIPVASHRWHDATVHQALVETLRLLTGDAWEFAFVVAKALPIRGEQSVLRLSHKGAVAMPYSDGLDSFSVARILTHHFKSTGNTLIRVTTGPRANVDDNLGQVRAAVPFRMSKTAKGTKLRESSYRSRGFVFGSLAGLAVCLAGGSRVVIPESGQSTFGPALSPVGGEAIDLRANPLFTRRLGDFLSRLLEKELAFEHPQQWKTKGETLAELNALGLASGWHNTHSCPRSVRHIGMHGKRVNCGVCAACLLRRQSVLRAELSSDEYQWQNLKASSLDRAAAESTRPTNADDLKHARYGTLCMADFAQLAAQPDTSPFHHVAEDLVAMPDDVPHVLTSLRRLATAHANEWHTFIASQGQDSFLNQILAGAS